MSILLVFMRRLKNICNMEDITIKQYDDGYFEVFQGDKSSGELSYDEMLGLITSLTMSERRPCLQWMKTKEQRNLENIVITQIAKYPMFENTQKKK
nr:MAG TPA: hypothetical protein [Caudoviricetes sp.]